MNLEAQGALVAGIGVVLGLGLSISVPTPSPPTTVGTRKASASVAMAARVVEGGARRLQSKTFYEVSEQTSLWPFDRIELRPKSRVVLSGRSAGALARGKSRFLIGSNLQYIVVEQGMVLATSKAGSPNPIRISSWSSDFSVEGPSVGMIVGPRTLALVLEGKAEVSQGARTVSVRGPAVLPNESETAIPLPNRLEITVDEVVRSEKKTSVKGKTLRGVMVRLQVGEVSARGRAGASGRFSLSVEGVRREEFEVEAEDILGRVARPTEPSRSLTELREEMLSRKQD